MGNHFKTPDTLVRTLSHTLNKGEASQALLEATREILMMANSNTTFPPSKWKGLELGLIEADAID